MKVPRVSIGLPVYNGENFLRSAVDSILQQDYTDFELIISDNASQDATEKICREYAAKDSRIRYHRNEKNIGASGNYNRVFELARGEFFKWISHDDECAPSFLRRCMETFDKASADIVLVCAHSRVIDEAGHGLHTSKCRMKCAPKPSSRLASLLSRDDYPYPLWGLIRSNALRQTRLIGIVQADHVLLAELAILGNFAEIPEELQRWRIHSGNANKVHRTLRELLSWYDPRKAKNRIVLPQWLAWPLEYFWAVSHIRLPLAERMKCYCIILWCAIALKMGAARDAIGLRTRFKRGFQKLARYSSKWQRASRREV